jgi:hypothetical protein
MKLKKHCYFFGMVLLFAVNITGFAQNVDETEMPLTIIIPTGYDFTKLKNQSIHSPALGAGFLAGEQNLPFSEVETQFLGMAIYQPFMFTDELILGLPKTFHQIDAMFDGRIKRHQLLAMFKSASDKPVNGGLHTFQTAAAWGYEIIRRPNISLILGAALAVSDFGMDVPIMPLPLIRFNLNTQWFVSKFEFLSGPNLSFTVAPYKRIRLSADMRMDNYRFIEDLNYEFTLWYRLFGADSDVGDFAGIGFGIKNEIIGFDLSKDFASAESFDIQMNSIFAAIDLSILTIQGGWVFDSAYFVDDKKRGNPGDGFYVSIQGIIPINVK